MCLNYYIVAFIFFDCGGLYIQAKRDQPHGLSTQSYDWVKLPAATHVPNT